MGQYKKTLCLNQIDFYERFSTRLLAPAIVLYDDLGVPRLTLCVCSFNNGGSVRGHRVWWHLWAAKLNTTEGGMSESVNGNPLTRDQVLAILAEGGSLAGANLKEVDLCRVDLCGVDLAGSNLHGAQLAYAKLKSANLRDAQLEKAFMFGAELIDACLIGAHLKHADLRFAKLQGTDVSGVDLSEANLVCAELKGIVHDDATKLPDHAL